MSQMTQEEINRHKENPNIILKIGGRSFRCECGCNVFHHPGTDDDKFQCNSCGAIYDTNRSECDDRVGAGQ